MILLDKPTLLALGIDISDEATLLTAIPTISTKPTLLTSKTDYSDKKTETDKNRQKLPLLTVKTEETDKNRQKPSYSVLSVFLNTGSRQIVFQLNQNYKIYFKI